MSTPTRIYLVTPATGPKRLVRAPNSNRVLRHVATPQYKIEVPDQEAFAVALTAGIKIEDAKESDDE